ncbi:hypothetical protein CTAYLR_006071 [Chrysophaeum taylorii]|uniref:GST N-terminal domain-containing protein n=1 Tax=Chrysophaeum taylorii TaxID=2483200 RepID=A0AAD7UL98_9STRA|nr:hypothetical protein CTAYLR_006071 [Chrysophaeum taylorii]
MVSAAGECATTIEFPGREPGRFELFAMRQSICSQKVRCCLMLKENQFVEHEMVPFKNYEPAYARLRQAAGAAVMTPRAWDGSSSASVHGVDPLVVPTLVDNAARRVIVDSKAIVEYIDREVASDSLQTCNDDVRTHLAIVDEFPHPGLLYHGDPDHDSRPEALKTPMGHYGELMIATLEEWLSRADLPADLRPLYDVKLKKAKMIWTGAGDTAPLGDLGDFHRTCIRKARRCLDFLDAELLEDKMPTGPKPSAADVAWFVTLLRITELGLAEELINPRVEAYLHRLLGHPKLLDTFIWSHLPSPHLTPILLERAGKEAAQDNDAQVAAWQVGRVDVEAHGTDKDALRRASQRRMAFLRSYGTTAVGAVSAR